MTEKYLMFLIHGLLLLLVLDYELAQNKPIDDKGQLFPQ